jgi:hypothetical protein
MICCPFADTESVMLITMLAWDQTYMYNTQTSYILQTSKCNNVSPLTVYDIGVRYLCNGMLYTFNKWNSWFFKRVISESNVIDFTKFVVQQEGHKSVRSSL